MSDWLRLMLPAKPNTISSPVKLTVEIDLSVFHWRQTWSMEQVYICTHVYFLKKHKTLTKKFGIVVSNLTKKWKNVMFNPLSTKGIYIVAGKLTSPMSKIFKITIFGKNCFSVSEVYHVKVWYCKTIGKVRKISYL